MCVWVCWLFGFVAIFSPVTAIQPDLTIHLCKIPMSSSKWLLCCVTKDIHSATVTFFHQSPQRSKVTDIAIVKHPCNFNTTSNNYAMSCGSEVKGQRVLTLTVFSPNLDQDIGTWGCRYYGKSSALQIEETQVLTEDGGIVLVNKSEDVRLNFGCKAEDNITIYNPEGTRIAMISSGTLHTYAKFIKHLSFDITSKIVSLVLQNLTRADNGTYVCEQESDKFRYGLTIVILEKLDKPQITSAKVTFEPSLKKVKFANLTCTAERKSASPYYYSPEVETRWIYPRTDVGYNASEFSNWLLIAGVNCTVNKSQPVFCEAREKSGPMSNRTNFYPHSLCSLSVGPTLPPVITVVPGEDNSDNNQAILIAMAVIGFVGFFLFVIMYCAGKHKVGHCFSLFSMKLGWCCGRTVCRRCMKPDDDDFYSDYISNMTRDPDDPYFTILRERSSNLRDLMNVYSPGTDNIIPLPLPPPLPRENNNTVENENEDAATHDSAEPNGVAVVLGAEGIDRSVLIKEVEHGLGELRRTLHNSQSQVQVIRENLMENLFDIYTDPTIVDSYLHVKMVDEQGSDWGGVSRDCFTSFWNEATEKYFLGNSVLIPYLPPHRLEEEYKFRLLGRILAHSTAILGYIPVPLCKSVVMVTILDTTTIDENTLLEDFMLFLDRDDAGIIRLALTDFGSLSEEDRDNLQGLFSRFDMGCLIQASTFRDQLLKMARSELCLKPRSLCELIREGIPSIHYERFWSQLTIDHLQILNDRLKPTADKIIACLRMDDTEPNHRTEKVFEYFKDLIEDLPQEDLETLLQFITGQSCVPRRSITVNFSDLSGVERRPIAHTCSYSIEIPDTYRSYEEFESEFKAFLKSDIIRFDMQ